MPFFQLPSPPTSPPLNKFQFEFNNEQQQQQQQQSSSSSSLSSSSVLISPPLSPIIVKQKIEKIEKIEKFHDELGIKDYTFAELSSLFKNNLFQLIINYNDYLFHTKQKILFLFEIYFSISATNNNNNNNNNNDDDDDNSFKLKPKLSKQFDSRYIELFEYLYMANFEIWSLRKTINLIIMTMKYNKFINRNQVIELNNKIINDIKDVQKKYQDNDDNDIDNDILETDEVSHNNDEEEDEFEIGLLDKCPELCQDLLELDNYLTHNNMSIELPSLTLDEFIIAIKDVSQLELQNKKKEQLHFIFKLIETNNELNEEIKIETKNELNEEIKIETNNKDDLQYYKETIVENKHYLLQQLARIKAINSELVNRGLLNEQTKKNEELKLINEINEKSNEKSNEIVQEQEGIYL
ncbi:unnamed protein product [Candida verbasci]|uniref:Uncharacterized protein n=1 Tax=Candida verbasci TaxID=1227364 RepID=A0A9W4XBI6_9ASCO|nr:unnamed protein product [Candida verbasci]